MDRYQEMAAGKSSDTEERSGESHKIGIFAAVLLLLCSVVLDVWSLADLLIGQFPLSDVIATVFSVLLLIYFTYKGIAPLRPMIRWLMMYFIEYVPFLDYLPFYTIGIILVLLVDRSEIASTAVQYIPSKNLAGRKAAGGAASQAAERLSSRLEKNKVFGEASEKYTKKIAEARQKLPGPLRSLPESGNRGTDEETSPRLGLRGVVSDVASSFPKPSSPLDQSPFPGTYEDLEREMLPELEDVVNVDVSGSRAVANTPPPSPRV